jgi:hypothetical protein
MPRVSAKIDKFLQEETLTTQEKSDIRGDLGAETAGAAAAAQAAAIAASQPLDADLTAYAAGPASAITTALQGAEADPARIGAEYLPETLTPSVIAIPDFGASFGPAGSIGTRGGVLALGNGANTNDSAAPRRVAGSYFGDLTGLNKLAARIAIVGIPLTATETVAGTEIQISGTLKLLFPPEFYVAEEPILGIKIGLALDGHETDVATDWMNHESLPAGAGEFIPILTNHLSLRVYLSNNVTEGADQLIHDNVNSVIVADRVGSTDGIDYLFISNGLSSLTTNPVAAGNSITEEVATTLWISVEIVTGASGTHSDTPFSAVYDLDTKVILP